MALPALLNEKTSPIISDRGDHFKYHHSWKEDDYNLKSKSTQSALSALTLLAFLFFLNILQSCLQDSLQSQAPITIVMTTTSTTTQSDQKRQKRSDKQHVEEVNIDFDENQSSQNGIPHENINEYNNIDTEHNGVNTVHETSIAEELRVTDVKEFSDETVTKWIYESTCCTCGGPNMKHSGTLLRSGLSVVCAFIDAITIHGKCDNYSIDCKDTRDDDRNN